VQPQPASAVQKAQQIVPVPTLCFNEGMQAGLRIRLDQDVATFGRHEDNGYVLTDPRISRVHAQLRKEGNVLIVTDLGSSSGTKVNGERIGGPTAVRHGDTLSFGPLTAALEDPAGAVQREESTMVFATPEVETGPHLSPRQQQVLELMAEGMTNSQIGEQLGITERTVKAYAQELYDKLGVRNRAGAVAQGGRRDLI
jgi:pSer/pThr/pTyr-binding forkhead associated (FHA) protein